ncbi:MAG: hypothetical protein BWY13_00118 [Euryarchaeota archaeon ADurb.Bin190]|nr:MAG: hypothetical protein BWY13_00118 [Euryarchaeota archaeon ADurb.Bin190]
MANILSSVGSAKRPRSSSSVHWEYLPEYPSSLSISRERMAFCMDSSRLLPMAITSPVDFMAVVRLLLARTNLSNGQRGIFVTT